MHSWTWGLVGKGSITEEHGDAEYTVSLDYGSAFLNAEVAKLDQSVAQIDEDIVELEALLATFESELTPLQNALDSAISSLNFATTEEERLERAKAVDAATAAIAVKSQEINTLKPQVAYLKIRRADLLQRKAYLEAQVTAESKRVWCADYTTDMTGVVSTIEVNGEQPQTLIAPGGGTPDLGDGDFRHRLSMSAAATFVNVAHLPAWQKWRPTYREGYLTIIDRENNTGTVILNVALSSAQDLDINQSLTLTDVPFRYLTCDHAAFDVGDDVLVQFDNQDWSSPRIIGFTHDPKTCGPDYIWIPIGTDSPELTAWPGVNPPETSDALVLYNGHFPGLDSPLTEVMDGWFSEGSDSTAVTGWTDQFPQFPGNTALGCKYSFPFGTRNFAGTTHDTRIYYSQPWYWDGSRFKNGFDATHYDAAQELTPVVSDPSFARRASGQQALDFGSLNIVYNGLTGSEQTAPAPLACDDHLQDPAVWWSGVYSEQSIQYDRGNAQAAQVLQWYEDTTAEVPREITYMLGGGSVVYDLMAIQPGGAYQNDFQLPDNTPVRNIINLGPGPAQFAPWSDGHPPYLHPGLIYARRGLENPEIGNITGLA